MRIRSQPAHSPPARAALGGIGYMIYLHTQVSYPNHSTKPACQRRSIRREPAKSAGKYREKIHGKDRGALHLSRKPLSASPELASTGALIPCRPLNMRWRCSGGRCRLVLHAVVSTGSPIALPRSPPRRANSAHPENGHRWPVMSPIVYPPAWKRHKETR